MNNGELSEEQHRDHVNHWIKEPAKSLTPIGGKVFYFKTKIKTADVLNLFAGDASDFLNFLQSNIEPIARNTDYGLFEKLFPETPVDKPLHVELSDPLPIAGIDFMGAGYDW